MTHLTIALANYCSSKLRKSTACLEINHTGAFNRLSAFTSEKTPYSKLKADPVISIYNVDYYPTISLENIPEIFGKGYCYLLLDFGVLTDLTFHEFLRCDRKIVIGSLSPWKEDLYHQFFNNYLLQMQWNSFVCLVLFGEKQDIHRFSGKYHISMKQVPFIRNPFHITQEQFLFLQELL